MIIEKIGEFGFIERCKEKFASLTPENYLGIGDDCAIIPMGDQDLIFSTDLLVENVHFLREVISPEQLGYKSLAVNLSDIAAMGGDPVGSFLSIALPENISVEYLDGFLNGYHILSEKYNVPLLGGDTTKSPGPLTINVGIMGKLPSSSSKRRNQAKDKDIVCVTGSLGDSAAGLDIILNNIPFEDDAVLEYLIKKHLQPEPLLNEGKWLRQRIGVNAMIDVSDGIASDLKRILDASHLSASINIENIPISYGLHEFSKSLGIDPLNYALKGGEEYELICTVAENTFLRTSQEFYRQFGASLIAIGHLQPQQEKEIIWLKEGSELDINISGFDHFLE